MFSYYYIECFLYVLNCDFIKIEMFAFCFLDFMCEIKIVSILLIGILLICFYYGICLYLFNSVREDFRGYEDRRLMVWVELVRFA